jgi:deoxycytidylate deaminase
MEIAHLVKKRATCLRRQVGAVLVKDKNILATGYNGAPSGIEHCLDRGCLREQMGIPSGEPRPARGAECDHTGCPAWNEHRRRHALLYEPALRHLRQDDH